MLKVGGANKKYSGLHGNINVPAADYRDFIMLVSCGFMLMLLPKKLKISVSSLKNQKPNKPKKARAAPLSVRLTGKQQPPPTPAEDEGGLATPPSLTY